MGATPKRSLSVSPPTMGHGSEHGQTSLAVPLGAQIDLIEYLRKNENLNLRIEGYADGIGSYHSNRSISIARAEAVKEYLVKRGINKNRVTTAGNGFIKDQPKDTSQYNRRVEFIIK